MLPLLAQAAPDATTTGNVVLVLVLVIGQVVSLIISGLGLWIGARRHPPVAEEMNKLFVPRIEYLQAIDRIHERIDQSNTEISTARNQFAKVFADIERAIGLLEGTIRGERRRGGHDHG